MFSMVACTPMSRDCTCGYKVFLEKEYTVEEFINAVLKAKSDEWGYIGIYKKGSIFGEPNCEYRNGKLSTKPMPNKFLKKKIVDVIAGGGYSRMDYLLYV